jgi:two-component system, sensor histidine kinase and response regulator
MNGVIGMTEILLESKPDDEQRRQGNTILDSARSLLTFINDILDISKLEAGQFSLDLRPFELAELLDGVMDTMAVAATRKGIELGASFARDVPATVVGDPVRLRQILLNMIGNAIKFTDEGAVIVHVFTESANESSTHLRFDVADTGLGIPSEEQGQLFVQFSQLDSSDTRKYEGTGLGLAICKRLAELMGGRVGVVSVLGKGSTFWFTVDCATEASKAGAGCASSALAVLEPNPHLAKVFRRFGRHADLSVDVFATTDELNSRLNSALPFDAVIVDIDALDQRSVKRAHDIASQCTGVGKVVAFRWLISDADAGRTPLIWDLVVTKPLSRHRLDIALDGPRALSKRSKALRAVGRSASLLLVEDNKVNQMVARSKLTKLGHKVAIANNGEEAVHAVRQHAYELVLMDVQMPVMDGIEATSIIRADADPRVSDITIVALTANAMKGDEERFRAAGMNDYLAKPIDAEAFEAVLERWLGDDVAPAYIPRKQGD